MRKKMMGMLLMFVFLITGAFVDFTLVSAETVLDVPANSTEEKITDMESEIVEELVTEVSADSDIETETEIQNENDSLENGESNEFLPINETAIYNALDSYFANNKLDVVIVSERGFDRDLDNLTFAELCLLFLLLIDLGRSILHIVGGRAWNK